ncbi:MAG: alpha/beta fold hydrolase [Streptosporangiaceae bacterium]
MDGPRIVDVHGVDLCVDTAGDAADPAILLIGGMGDSMDWWEDEFCQRLAAGGRFVIRYDHRDTGRSVSYPAGAPGYTGADLAADAAGVLDAFGRRSAHLAGVSMGGALAQQLALGHPDRVDSLVLMSTQPRGPGRPRPAGASADVGGAEGLVRSGGPVAGLGRTVGGDRLPRRLRAAARGRELLRRSARIRARGADRRPHQRHGRQHDEPRSGRGG